MKVKIFTVAEVPEELAHAWLQHLRDFDTAHPDCHFQVFNDAPDVEMAEVIKLLQVEPKLTFEKFFDRRRHDDDQGRARGSDQVDQAAREGGEDRS